MRFIRCSLEHGSTLQSKRCMHIGIERTSHAKKEYPGGEIMQKQVRTIDGQTIYVNIVQQFIPTDVTPFAFPWLDVIYDLDSPAARVIKIFAQEGNKVV